MKYKCPDCGAVAEIDKEKKVVTVEVPAAKLTPPKLGSKTRVSTFTFPSHFDCEFNKTVDEIDLGKLEPVAQPFIYETVRGVPL